MPLTRKALKAMGVDEEKIEQIIDLHTETTDALKAERDNYKADAEKLQSVQRELDQANETLAKHGKGEVIAKSEYEKILNEFNDYKAQVTATETKHAKERAYREMLKANNVSEKRIDSIVKVANLEDFELSQWRLMHIGAQPVPPSLIKRWKEVFPNHQYDTNYGLSESIGPGCVHLGVENVHKVGAIGKAGYGWEVKIVDEHKNEVPKGEVGELAVKGPGVMLRYYKDEKATAETLSPDGWLYTGDMAMQDPDGFIYLVDRKKDVVISGGENLYPREIEEFYLTNPKVRDVQIVGVPDERYGEECCAWVILHKGETADEAEMKAFGNASIARHKVPRYFLFVEEFPMNAAGKILKYKMREDAARRLGLVGDGSDTAGPGTK